MRVQDRRRGARQRRQRRRSVEQLLRGLPAELDLDGKKLDTVNRLSFGYTGEATAGSPRFSLPIDTGSGSTAFYAFVGAFHCNDGSGLVDALNDGTCTIFAGGETFANWAAMVAAHPDWRVDRTCRS